MTKLEISKQLLSLLPASTGNEWIIDGGCYIGEFTANVIKEFPNSSILSFEPDPDSWVRAKDNIGIYSRVEVINAALGASNGQARFFRGPDPTTNSLLPRPVGRLKPYYPKEAVLNEVAAVNVVTIDDECQRRGINELALLKLDLQGGELDALVGAKKLLESGSIKAVIVEAVFIKKYQDQPLLWELWRYLEQYGYSLFSLEEIKVGLYHSENPSLRYCQWNQCDAIFISNPIRESLDRQGPSD
jgi:FkbM family methyltransferase